MLNTGTCVRLKHDVPRYAFAGETARIVDFEVDGAYRVEYLLDVENGAARMWVSENEVEPLP